MTTLNATENHANLARVLQLILGNPESLYAEYRYAPVTYTFQGFTKLVKHGLEIGEAVSPYGNSDLDEFLGISVEDYQALTEFETAGQIEMAINQILEGEPVRVPYHLGEEDYRRDCLTEGFIDALRFGCSLSLPDWDGIEIENYDDLKSAVDEAVNNFVGYLTNGDILKARECGSWEAIGADLFFTAGGHGAGFWDGDYKHADDSTLGHRLTEAAKLCGMSGVDLYEGDDGGIYAYGF